VPEIVNTEQAGTWDGPQGDVWVAREPMLNAALAQHTARLLEVAAVQAAEQVLDVGCGTGDTTRACARRAVDGEAMGVDLSSAMLRRARVRADEAGLRNVSFVQADAQVHPFDAGRFDVVLSRFGVMFFADPVEAFSNLARATKPGGRFVAVVWQPLDRNQWVIEPRAALLGERDVPAMPEDVPGPFGLADGERTRRILTDAGWTQVGLDVVAVPYYFGADADAATRTRGRSACCAR
jgi:SAM-dependent methyltransferase